MMSEMPQAEAQADQAVMAPQTPIAPASDAPTPQDTYAQVSGYSEQAAGITGEQKAKEGAAKSTAAALDAARDESLAYEQKAQSDLTEKDATIRAVTDDVRNGHIKPNDYMDSLSTVGKISTAVGLILGGIGGGQMHQANPALQFLNAQIERNIEGQKADMANKHNLLSALHQQYGDTIVAQNMHRAIQSNILANQIESGIATANGQLAKSSALQAFGALKQQTATYLRTAHLAQMQADVAGTGAIPGLDTKAQAYLQAARLYDPKSAEEFEKRYIPSVGVANVPLEPKDRDLLQKKTELSNLLNRAGDYLQSSGTLGPILPAKRAEALGLQNEINLKMGQLDDLTRFTPEENKIYKKSVPNLTGTHFTDKDKALLQDLKNNNDASLNTFYQQKGIGKVANSQPVVKGKDGKMYQKSPDGKYMIPVR
jgi:hypothetical protein